MALFAFPFIIGKHIFFNLEGSTQLFFLLLPTTTKTTHPQLTLYKFTLVYRNNILRSAILDSVTVNAPYKTALIRGWRIQKQKEKKTFYSQTPPFCSLLPYQIERR